MLQWRLKAYRYWAKLEKSKAEPKWANVHYPPIHYQAQSLVVREREGLPTGATLGCEKNNGHDIGHSGSEKGLTNGALFKRYRHDA